MSEPGQPATRRVDRLSPVQAVRSGRADEYLRNGEAAISQVERSSAELARREQRSIIERVPLGGGTPVVTRPSEIGQEETIALTAEAL